MRERIPDIIMEKIRSIFPNKNEEEVLDQLEAYGTEPYEREKFRVYLAILKLSEEHGLVDPSDYIRAAKEDYRDVLYWAEYPNEARSPTFNEIDLTKIEKIKKHDKEQYNKWLNGNEA